MQAELYSDDIALLQETLLNLPTHWDGKHSAFELKEVYYNFYAE